MVSIAATASKDNDPSGFAAKSVGREWAVTGGPAAERGSRQKVASPAAFVARTPQSHPKLCGFVLTHFHHPFFSGYEWDSTGIGSFALGIIPLGIPCDTGK